MFTWIGSLNMHSVRYPAVSSYLNLKHFEVPKQNTTLGSWCFHHLASTHQIRSALCRQTAGACVLWVCPATDPWLNWLSQGVNGLPASSCGLGATVRPVALSPSVSLRVRDIIVSVLVVLKSPFVDVEDFDRVVGTGAGKLDPGALLLDFTPSISLSIPLVVLSTYSAGLGPPAEPLDRQSVALSAKGFVMKENNMILLWMTEQAWDIIQTNTHYTYFTICLSQIQNM